MLICRARESSREGGNNAAGLEEDGVEGSIARTQMQPSPSLLPHKPSRPSNVEGACVERACVERGIRTMDCMPPTPGRLLPPPPMPVRASSKDLAAKLHSCR